MTCPTYGGANAFIQEGQCVWARASGRSFDQDATFETIGINEDSFQVAGGVQGALGEVWRRQHPDIDEIPEVFTTRCPVCKGTMFVAGPGQPLDVDEIRSLSARGRALAAREARPDPSRWIVAALAVLALAIAALAFALST